MPAWGVHLRTANDLLKYIKLDENSFLMGNLIADAERYVINNFSVYIPYEISHFGERVILDGHMQTLPGIERFIEKYKNKFNNPMIVGYLTHLLTDYFWNSTFHRKYVILNEKGQSIGLKLNNGTEIFCEHDERVHKKHNDFWIFENYVNNTFKLKTPKYEECLLEQIKEIDEIPFNEEDLKKIEKYTSEKHINANVTENYIIFNKQEMEEDYKECIKFIMKYFNKYNIK